MTCIRQAHSKVIDAGFKSTHAPSANDHDIVKQYSATLVRKLEEKTIQLEAANLALQREVAERARMALVQTGILNALPARVALLDSDGMILEVNDPWRRFATAGGLQSPDSPSAPTICRSATAPGPAGAMKRARVAAGVRRVLAGEAAEFSFEYPCRSPRQERWFRLVVSPLRQFESSGAVVMHVDITSKKLDQASVKEVSKRLETLIEQANVGILVQQDFKRSWRTPKWRGSSATQARRNRESA